MEILSENQLLKIFSINEITFDTLVKKDKLSANRQFSQTIITNWLRKGYD
jgi:hypothetical protein